MLLIKYLFQRHAEEDIKKNMLLRFIFSYLFIFQGARQNQISRKLIGRFQYNFK